MNGSKYGGSISATRLRAFGDEARIVGTRVDSAERKRPQPATSRVAAQEDDYQLAPNLGYSQ